IQIKKHLYIITDVSKIIPLIYPLPRSGRKHLSGSVIGIYYLHFSFSNIWVVGMPHKIGSNHSSIPRPIKLSISGGMYPHKASSIMHKILKCLLTRRTKDIIGGG